MTAKKKAPRQSPQVGVVMGGKSDLQHLLPAKDVLESLGIPYEMKVVSAHRTPKWMFEYAETAEKRGLKVLVAAAGGAAHLPGMLSALTPLPVLGVPMPTTLLQGVDSLLSIVQMPKGVPVGTLAIGAPGAANAALLAASILALSDDDIRKALHKYRAARTDEVMRSRDL